MNRVLGVVFLLFAGLGLVFSSVNIHPTEIFVKPPSKSAPIVVTNPTDKETEVWFTFSYGYPVSFDSGRIGMAEIDTSSYDEPSAAKWLRAIPQRFTLKPQENQVVRIYGTPPPGLRAGEYWARIVINSKTRKTVIPLNQGETRLNMDLITQTVVPFHFRNGATTTGITIREAHGDAIGKALKMHLVFDRSGNASYWGRMITKVINPGGKVIRTKESRLVVYKSMDYQFDIDLAGEPSGRYAVEMAIDNRHPGLSPEFRIPVAPVTQRMVVVIP